MKYIKECYPRVRPSWSQGLLSNGMKILNHFRRPLGLGPLGSVEVAPVAGAVVGRGHYHKVPRPSRSRGPLILQEFIPGGKLRLCRFHICESTCLNLS